MARDKDYLIENLAMLIDSGMDILSSLQVIEQEVQSKPMKKKLKQLIADVEAGFPLWRAMDKAKIVSTANIALIHIGEDSAQLAQNLDLIALQHQKRRGFESKLRSALMYPVLILCLTLFIGISISWFILPKLAKVFTDMKIELPLMTKILLGAGNILEHYGIFIIPGIVLLFAVGMYVLFFYEKTRFIGQKLLFVLPVIKQVLVEIEVARFGQVLGTLLGSGLPIVAAMNSIIEATSLVVYQRLYTQMRDNIVDGDSFKSSFERIKNVNRYVPLFIQKIIIAGERSGNLSNALLKIGQIYEEKTEETTRNLTVLMEPIMLIIIWFGVIGAAMAVVMPIYNLIGNLNS